jgi:hypothetical protein
MSDLKACPFCGSADVISHSHFIMLEHSPSVEYAMVHCVRCGASATSEAWEQRWPGDGGKDYWGMPSGVSYWPQGSGMVIHTTLAHNLLSRFQQ